jgi:hypothetical protein
MFTNDSCGKDSLIQRDFHVTRAMIDKLREENRVQMVKDQLEKDRKKAERSSSVSPRKGSSPSGPGSSKMLLSSDSSSFVFVESPFDLDDTKSPD